MRCLITWHDFAMATLPKHKRIPGAHRLAGFHPIESALGVFVESRPRLLFRTTSRKVNAIDMFEAYFFRARTTPYQLESLRG